MSAYNRVDVEFPQQIEVRVNQRPVAGKTKGLKNKPGTTHPLDITDYIQSDRVIPAVNGIQITYALNQKVSTILSMKSYIALKAPFSNSNI